MDKVRQVKYKGQLNLAGFELPCYVLEDGTRVLSNRKLIETLKMVDEKDKKGASGKTLGRNLTQKSLKPFVDKGTGSGNFEKIICYDKDRKIHGYEATALIDICRIYSKASREIHLSPRQKIIANQAIILLETFAKTGLIALIDEVTGYQAYRQNNELLSEWKKELRNELQKEIKTALTSQLANYLSRPPPNSVGSFTYDPLNNSLTYQNKPCEYWLESNKGLKWFILEENQIKIKLGLIFRSEDKLLTYAQIIKNGVRKDYRNYFEASLHEKVVFNFTSDHEYRKS